MNNALGRILKAGRERAGLSQTEAARRSGLDHTSISRIEAGNRMPVPHTFNVLAALYNLNDYERRVAIEGYGFDITMLPDYTSVLIENHNLRREVADLRNTLDVLTAGRKPVDPDNPPRYDGEAIEPQEVPME